jgi:hypothetical protein
MKNEQWKMTNGLESRQVVVAVCALNERLALSVVARSGNGFEASLVNRLTATGADAVASFLDSQQRLIDIGDDFRAAFAEPQRDLFVQILHRKIDAVFHTVVVKFEGRRLVGADLFGFLPKLLDEKVAKMGKFFCVH